MTYNAGKPHKESYCNHITTTIYTNQTIINCFSFCTFQIDGHDSGTESDGDLNNRDELHEHDMDLSEYYITLLNYIHIHTYLLHVSYNHLYCDCYC